MECRDTKLLIESYWDRHLQPETAERVERHLKECPVCRAEYGAVTQLLTGPEPVAVPAGLRERICSAVEMLPMPAGETAGASPRLRRWQSILQAPWAGALAACVTFAFLGWLSSQIPGGGLRVEGNRSIERTRVSSNSPLGFGWAQSMGVLAAVAQATAMDTTAEAPDAAPASLARERLRLSDLPAADSTPVMPGLPIVAGALCAGYSH
jgi:predicted anti-sigma-YlaC factor YlaD